MNTWEGRSNYAIWLTKSRAVLEELPGKERAIIEGIYLADKNASLVAGELGISLSYLYRLQKKLSRSMGGKLSNFIKEWG